MTESKWNWYDFDKLKSSDDLNEYFSDKSYHHSNYYHYTNLKGIEGIIGSKCFFVSQVEAFNDTVDTEHFENQKSSFVLCFATGVHENLPMWYMYSGVDGKGGRLSFTKDSVRKIVEQSEYILCEKGSGKRICVLTEDDYEKSFEDVLYYSQENKSKNVVLRYNNMMNKFIDTDVFKEYQSAHPYVIKDNVWFYEKETRLVIKLKKHIIDKMNPKKDYRIEIHFSKIPRLYYKVTLAPEWIDINSLKKEMFPNICSLLTKKDAVSLSEFSGKIHMKLCSGCTYNKCSNCDETNCSKRKELKK